MLSIAVVVVAVGTGVVFGLNRSSGAGAPPVVNGSARPVSAAIIPVDALAGSPDQYVGRVTVSGSVTSIDAASHSLVLGCADACVAVPVKFDGNLPKVGSNVIVQGSISKSADGTYSFVATDVKTVG